jgi:hypothetical protein
MSPPYPYYSHQEEDLEDDEEYCELCGELMSEHNNGDCPEDWEE